MTFTRRTFFQSTAAAAAASTVTRAGAEAGPRPLPMKIGLASYSMRSHSLDKVIELCKAADVKYLTLKDMHLPRTDTPEALAAAKAKIAAAGIIVTGGGVINMKNDPDQVRKDFEYARASKLPMIVGSPDPDALDLVEKMVKEFGIPVAIHNHGPEDKKFPSPRDIMAAIKKRDKRLGVCMDIGHTVRAGVDPIACVKECGARLMDLHVKDLRDTKDKNSQVEVGRGSIDIVGLFKALHKQRFAGHANLEYEINADNPAAGIRESLAYMRGVAAAIG